MTDSEWGPLLDDLAVRRRAAAAMGGPERLARQHEGGRLDARARIGHLEDSPVIVPVESQGNLASLRGKLNGVAQEVHEGLVQPMGVRKEGDAPTIHANRESDSPPNGEILYGPGGVFEKGINERG